MTILNLLGLAYIHLKSKNKITKLANHPGEDEKKK